MVRGRVAGNLPQRRLPQAQVAEQRHHVVGVRGHVRALELGNGRGHEVLLERVGGRGEEHRCVAYAGEELRGAEDGAGEGLGGDHGAE
jgi:hypothetical protein